MDSIIYVHTQCNVMYDHKYIVDVIINHFVFDLYVELAKCIVIKPYNLFLHFPDMPTL